MSEYDWRNDVDPDVVHELSQKILEMFRRRHQADVLSALEIAIATPIACSSKTHQGALTIMSQISEAVVDILNDYRQSPGCHWEKEH